MHAALLLLAGCTPSAAPITELDAALRDFAQTQAESVYAGIWAGIQEQDGHDLDQLDSGTSLAGELALPTDSGDGHGVDGELSASWTLTHSYNLDGGYQHVWDWVFDEDIQRLRLASSEVQGSGRWTVTHTRIESDLMDHGWEGQLQVDGGASLDVRYDARFSGNLHWVRGTIGDTEVDWENPNPDLP